MDKPTRKVNGGRALKRKVLVILEKPNWDDVISDILKLPPRRVVNPLFSFFYRGEETVRWRAISAMGTVVSRLAETDIESARVVMRRLIWNLNDESGGIGWGSPEAMGDITARSRRLAEEFGSIVVSYIREDGNYLEHEVLQRGAVWGVGRMAGAHPDLAVHAIGHLNPYLKTNDPWLRGLAAWAAGEVRDTASRSILCELQGDPAQIKIYRNVNLEQATVGELATEALLKLP